MKPNVYELKVTADIDILQDVLDFTDEILEKHNCPIKAITQINIALEELYVNIAHYAYPEGKGEALIRLSLTTEYAEITLIDSGIPYNPLAKPDPDTTLSAKERMIGGLGIFMSKKLMDEISYQFIDGKNHITIKRLF